MSTPQAFSIMRDALQATLRDALGSQTKLELGAAVKGIRAAAGGGSEVALADGTARRFDLVAGCDGVRGAVARHPVASAEVPRQASRPVRPDVQAPFGRIGGGGGRRSTIGAHGRRRGGTRRRRFDLHHVALPQADARSSPARHGHGEPGEEDEANRG